jgi:hypothetical protein
MLVSNEWIFNLLILLISGSYVYTSAVLWYVVKLRNNHVEHLRQALDELKDRIKRLEN